MVKSSKTIAQQLEILEKSNIHIKSVTIEQPNISRKLSMTIRHDKKASQVRCAGKNSTSLLYSETIKTGNFLDEKNTRL